MIFENDVLKKIHDKQKYNKQISDYFYKLYIDDKGYLNRYLNLSNNVGDCMKSWFWDCYHLNKVLDLRKVNRCKNRFCANCRKFDLAKALHNLSPHFENLIKFGYYPFLLTLTVPNCKGEDLRNVLDKMQKSFVKFWNWLNKDDKKGYKQRFFKFEGAVKCIEITYNFDCNTYHPHYHLLIFLADYEEGCFRKVYEGEYSNKRCSYNFYSDVDYQLRKLWTIAYDGLRLSDYCNLDVYKTYLCDIKELDSSGLFEVMKYVVKDSDILNYGVFKSMYYGLYGRRIRQGYGLLYNLKLEDDVDGEKQDLQEFIKIKESPIQLLTTDMETLYRFEYSNYIKLSRFNQCGKEFDKLND